MLRTFARRVYCLCAVVFLGYAQCKMITACAPLLWSPIMERQQAGVLIVTAYSFLIAYAFSLVISVWRTR